MPKRLTVAEAAEARYPGVTFDAALPQEWVSKMNDRGFTPVGQFVMLYPEKQTPYIAPITDAGVRMAAIIATYCA